MSFLDKFLNSMKLNDDEYDEYDEEMDYEEDEYEEEEEYEKPKKSVFQREKKAEPEPEPTPSVEREPARTFTRSSNVVPMRSVTRGMEVCMIKPATLNDGRQICDTLLDGCAVVINMEGIPTDTAQKIIDFTSGACYATRGNMQKISNFIFIATPAHVNLSGEFQDIMGGAAGDYEE